MNAPGSPSPELYSDGQEFARRQTRMAHAANWKQFRDRVYTTVGSAFALAQYVEDETRSRRNEHQTQGQIETPILPGMQWLADNTRLLRSAAMDAQHALRTFRKLPFARGVTGLEIPRIVGVAHALLNAVEYRWSIDEQAAFLKGYQAEEPLTVREIWAIPAALKLVLLEEILTQASGAFSRLQTCDEALEAAMHSLHAADQPLWTNVLEPLVPFEAVLQQDPTGTYSCMDFESRDLYRTTLAKIANRSPMPEMEVAQAALSMAQDAAQRPSANQRTATRRSHIGYYIVDEGAKELKRRCKFRPRFIDRARSALRSYPDDFYLGGIQTVALLAMAAIILPLVPQYNPLGGLLIAFFLLLLPVSQGAVELMNHTIAALLKPQALPKLDFSGGVTGDCKTLIAVPTLLLNERQVRELVEELEVRALANQDPNIHLALLTDLPDSVEEPRERDTDALVLLAGQLIEDLNRRYPAERCGRFLMLHRHRVFNPRQGVWMGWERKRGKLIDLNRLVMGGMDSFPFKAGDTSVLQDLRYVLTLDSDTKLPRDSARKMIGAIAHPLNRAILDPGRRIVTKGYGILQPRVGISVKSVARSRLAAIYSGQTGFDIYTRAISDVYQDLYGEGIFTGKGLYEIEVLHSVLDRRFPQNSLLSHDLIEGAYGRVGLLSDIDVIDDYPSHYSAQNRRKHRWVRGDWQILRWLLSRVPDDTGRMVHNPTSNISRWKILDNLRRSLVEPATLVLLTMGWLWLPGTPRYWTVATLLIVFVPVLVQFLFSSIRAASSEQKGYVEQSIRDSLGLLFSTALNFVFMAHQTLLMIDAIFRSLVRLFVTGERLLEWETAEQAEQGGKKQTPVETTMRFVPLLCIALAALVWGVRPPALRWALPILFLWSMSQPITLWLNRSPHNQELTLTSDEERLLRRTALRTWQYFEQYSHNGNHGLVPDNVQEEGGIEAARISPTNAGLQLNARQGAAEFGYLTLPEYVELTLANLCTLDVIPKWNGHLLNWYATDTLQPIAPFIVSSVDSGNFLASLVSLRMGTLEMRNLPFLPQLRHALLDLLDDLDSMSASDTEVFSAIAWRADEDSDAWLNVLLRMGTSTSGSVSGTIAEKLHVLTALVSNYVPWLLPEFSLVLEHLTDVQAGGKLKNLSPQGALVRCREMQCALADFAETPLEEDALTRKFAGALSSAESRLTQLMADLNAIATLCERMFQATDHRTLLDPDRRLLSIGYDTSADRRLGSCYDLLASEARIAMFLAIAKGDVPQEIWFKLGRKTALIDGNPTLLSWTGTMFEYLMPTLWMQTSPDTLLAQSLPMTVRAQQEFVGSKRMPWGISESGHSVRDAQGNYQYHAFGVPALAINPPPESALVIAPYASVLALETDPHSALTNMRNMEAMGWLGKFGFYESADYSTDREPKDNSRYVLVRSWMAHHQGMSLLAIANFLLDKPFQRWFHRDPRVRATELLLHEKPIQAVPPDESPKAASLPFRPGLMRKQA